MPSRKTYSKEFKLNAVSLVLEQGYTRSDAAKSLGINPVMLGRWVKEHQEDSSTAFRGQGKLSPEQDEMRKLIAQVKRLEMEKDILKKTATFFAKETQYSINLLTRIKLCTQFH